MVKVDVVRTRPCPKTTRSSAIFGQADGAGTDWQNGSTVGTDVERRVAVTLSAEETQSPTPTLMQKEYNSCIHGLAEEKNVYSVFYVFVSLSLNSTLANFLTTHT